MQYTYQYDDNHSPENGKIASLWYAVHIKYDLDSEEYSTNKWLPQTFWESMICLLIHMSHIHKILNKTELYTTYNHMQNTCSNTHEDTTFVHVTYMHMYLILLLFYFHLFSHYISEDKMNDKHVDSTNV